jgi:hypothetical protein
MFAKGVESDWHIRGVNTLRPFIAATTVDLVDVSGRTTLGYLVAFEDSCPVTEIIATRSYAKFKVSINDNAEFLTPSMGWQGDVVLILQTAGFSET